MILIWSICWCIDFDISFKRVSYYWYRNHDYCWFYTIS